MPDTRETRSPPCSTQSTIQVDELVPVITYFNRMTVYNLYVFDRNGMLLHYGEWNRKKQAGMSREEVSPTDVKEGFFNYVTNKYRLSFYETPTRIKFILNTDPHAQGVKELLHQIYTQVYVEYVVRNPMCTLNHPIESELFVAKLDELIKQSPAYTSRPA
ncbi:blocked early in transport 5 isoform X2 [Oratosquilla oratoria]|uniref:blocked early in transport 5 isoform X2 n=1 Tax=Oratosquilla oratoria TaxID=337810 RepID=UPI003F7755F0